jgi:hypothetical protein
MVRDGVESAHGNPKDRCVRERGREFVLELAGFGILKPGFATFASEFQKALEAKRGEWA